MGIIEFAACLYIAKVVIDFLLSIKFTEYVKQPCKSFNVTMHDNDKYSVSIESMSGQTILTENVSRKDVDRIRSRWVKVN